MDWIRQNKVLGTILILIVVGALALTGLLVKTWSGLSASQTELEEINGTLATIQKKPLYPSAENVDEKAKLVGEYSEAVNLLGGTLLNLQEATPVKPLSETEFQAKLKTSLSQIKDEAAKSPVKSGGMSLPPGEFDFGFKYLSPLPRNAEAATELGGYLDAASAIMNLMITAGVESVDSFQRSELAIEKGPPPPPKPEPERKSKSSKKKSKTGVASVKQVEVAQVVERRTITLTATMDQGALQTVMNQLASVKDMPFYTVVRQFRVENTKQEGPLTTALSAISPNAAPVPEEPAPVTEPVAPVEPTPDATSIAPATGSAAKPAAPTGPAPVVLPTSQPVVAPKPATSDSMVVFGDEKLKVFMEIDIVRFVAPKGEAAAD
jgi:hypothetical protein